MADGESVYKILILGDCNVGKTCIVRRFCDNSFFETYISTIGVDFRQTEMKLDNSLVKLQIWDTAGQERFRTLTTAYYRGAMGIIIVYDVTNMESFKHLSDWLENIEENASPNVVKILAGNKCDSTSNKIVDRTLAEKLASLHKMPFYEISCKNGANVGSVFESLAKMIKEKALLDVRLKYNMVEYY